MLLATWLLRRLAPEASGSIACSAQAALARSGRSAQSTFADGWAVVFGGDPLGSIYEAQHTPPGLVSASPSQDEATNAFKFTVSEAPCTVDYLIR